MGNTYQNSISPTLLQFEIVHTHPLDYYKEIKHKKNGQSLLVKQIIPVNNEHSNDIKTIIEAKMINKSTFVTQLVYWERPVSSQLCSRSQSFMLLFNNAGITLTEYIKKRQRSFSTQELSNILQQALKGLKYYNIVHHVHNQINSDCIFYNGQRAILIDPWLASNNDLNQKHPLNRRSIYRSPQRQLYQRDEIQSYDQSKSNIYQLGLLIIDLATNGKYSEQYNQITSKRESISKQKLNRVNIGAILEGIQDFKLKSKLNVLVNPNPDKRLTIFNIMLPQRITLKQFNSAHKNSNFKNLPHSRFYTDCTQNSNKKPQKSLKKSKNQPIKNNSDLRINSNQKKLMVVPQKRQQVTPQKSIYQRYFHNQNSFKNHSVEKSIQKIQRNKSLNTTPAGSTFTYAQWLPTYTQSNETGVYSKKQSKEETSSNANSIYYHQPHKILKIVKSNNTSVNSSFIKEPDKSPNKFGFSYHSQDNPNQSFINFLQKNNDNQRNRQRKDQNQDKQDDNLNIIEEQMNSYVTSYSPVIGSIPLSREDSKIRLSQNPSYSNLSPNRNNNRSNYQRVNKHSVQSTPQKIINTQRVMKTPLRQNINVKFHVSSPSPPHAHPIISKQHQQLNSQVISLPKPIKLSPGNNIFCTPQDLQNLNHMQQQKLFNTNYNTNYQLQNHPAIHPIVQRQITKTDSNKLTDQVGIQKLQSKTSKSSSKSSPPTPYFHRKLFPFQSFGTKQRTNPSEFQIQYQKRDVNVQSQGKKIIRQINTQEQDWEASMHKKTETIQSVEGDSQQGNQIRQVEQEYQQQKNYQKKDSKKQLQKKVSLKKLAQAQKKTQQIQQNKSKSSKSRKSYIKIVTPDKKKSIQQYQINITLSNDEDSGEDREKTNNIPSQVNTNKKQKRSHRNQYTSDLGSAKQTESIIFDSEQKKNSRLRRNRKQDHQSLHNSIQRNNLRKNISFGPQQITIKQKKSEVNINNNRILDKQPENNAKAKQESDFIKKIISMTKIQTQKANFDNIQKIDKKLHQLSLLARDKQEQSPKKQAKIIKKTSQPMNTHKSFNNVSVTNTLPMPIRNLKPLLENQGGKLAISIETDPLASIESVVDTNYGSSLFGRLKGFDKNSGSSPYLKNKKGLNMQKIQEKNVKTQQQLQSAIIGDQLGYSQDYNKIINKSATKNIKKITSGQSSHATDSLMMIGSQFRVPFQTQNSIINKLNQENINSQSAIHNENNQYNNQSNQSLKYYVIEKYPFPGKTQIFQKYQGYKCNGVRDGSGTYYYANGDIYHGEWKNDRHHGHGGIYRRKKNVGSKSQDTSVINQSIIHNRQQYYDTICEGIWDNGNFLPNIDTNSNQSNKNSSNPISPPSSANILSSSSPDKYKTSIINLLPVPLPIHTSYEDSSFLTKKSLNKQTSIVNSYNFSDLSRNQQLSSCSIGKNSRILDFNPLNQIITLKNGDLFKGIAITNLDSDAQMKIQGKLMKKNGQIVQGVWLYKDKQLFDIE